MKCLALGTFRDEGNAMDTFNVFVTVSREDKLAIRPFTKNRISNFSALDISRIVTDPSDPIEIETIRTVHLYSTPILTFKKGSAVEGIF